MASQSQVIERLIAAAFAALRTPRSEEYKAGIRAAIEQLLTGFKRPILYPIGTPQADAYFAGEAEGRTIWADHLVKQQRASEPAKAINTPASSIEDIVQVAA